MPFIGVQPSRGLVGTAGIDADAVTNAKIADDQIDSEHYVNGSIDTAHIAANAIDGTLTKDALIADFSDVTITASDLIMYGDATDSNNTKRDTVQGILDLAGGGAWAVVAHTNIAGSASEVAFTGLNVYPVYRFFINNIRIDGGSAGELRMRASDDNGSTYKSGVNYDWAHTYADARDEHGRYGGEDADTIVIIKDIGNPSSAEVTMYIPDASGESTARTTWTGTAQSTTSPGSVVSGQALGARTRDFGDQSDPVDAVKFYPSTGSLEGCGQITVLGMKTS